MKAVLVGCGGISREWFKGVAELEEVDLVGLVDLAKENAEARQKEYAPNAQIGANLAEMLRRTGPDIVFDCTVPAAHFEVVTTALRHGCHVLGEKPMADSLRQAQQMIQTAQAADKLFVVMQNWRYTHNIRRLKRFLRSDPIGTITGVNADFYIGAHFGGFREQMAHVLLKDMAIHTFDAARFLSGQAATSVYALEWNPAGSWYSRDAAAAALFEMTNGVIFNYRGSWSAEGLRTPWESAWRIIGTRGSVLWNGDTDMRCEVTADESGDSFLRNYKTVPAPHYPEVKERPERHTAVIHSFVESVQNGAVPETVCTDNIKSLAMVYGAVESAETGEKIAISF